MATLYKHGNIKADYTRYVMQTKGNRLGYIFREMSDGWTLIRSARAGSRWKLFQKHYPVAYISMVIDPILRKQIEANQ